MRKTKPLGASTLRFLFIALVGAIVLLNCGDDAERVAYYVPVKLTPVGLDGAGGGESDRAWTLFDRDSTTSWVPALDDGGRASLRVALDGPRRLSLLKVFGSSGYQLDVSTDDGKPVGSWQHIDLAHLGPGWNSFALSGSQTCDHVVLELRRISTTEQKAGDAGGIPEMELWGLSSDLSATLDDDAVRQVLSTGARLPERVQSLAAEPAAATLKATPTAITTTCTTFGFTLERNPSAYRRAWIAYIASGIFRPFTLTRTLNSGAMRRGQWMEQRPGTRLYVEPIDTELLQRGVNHIDYCLPSEASGAVTLRSIQFLGELDTGTELVASVSVGPVGGPPTSLADRVLDPYNTETIRVRAKERLFLEFDRWTTPDVVLVGSKLASWGLDCVDESGKGTAVPFTATSVRNGWHALLLDHPAEERICAGLVLTPRGAAADVSFLGVVGSGARRRIDWPRITLASQREHFGALTWIDGWANAPSGMEGSLRVEVEGQDTGTLRGVFGQLLKRDGDPDTDWSVTLTARVANARPVTRQFVLRRNGTVDSLAFGKPTRPGGLSATDSAVRYGRVGDLVERDVSSARGGSVHLGTSVGVDIPAGVLRGKTAITLRHLDPTALPPLDPGIINVTAPVDHGYEFLPHGQTFSGPVDVVLPYDPTIIPGGYTPEDVNTFYFDEKAKHWKRLARAKVDKSSDIVTSVTNHFTVMINAIVVAPEHPDITRFNPNEIRDIQAADPGSRVNLIEAPPINQKGDAVLSYPIEVPPGRRGLQPQLNLQYTSSRGNGWMGMGWDIARSTVTVDTRWGVPRYDPANETETYVLDGEQLAPFAHRDPTKPRTTDQEFHTRVEGAFRKIVRHGSDPKAYVWECIDKMGVRFFYGGLPGTGTGKGPDDNFLLRAGGGIFEWALREVRDTHGNSIQYRYQRVANPATPLGKNGSELYLSSISYTLAEGETIDDAPYSVEFLRDGLARHDVIIDARGGFKRVTAERLARINVKFNGALIRAYGFDYGPEGAFHKSLLRSIKQFGSNGTQFPGNVHRFTYFNDVQQAGDSDLVGFGTPDDWQTNAQDGDGVPTLPIQSFTNAVLGTGDVSALNGNQSQNTGGHLYVGFNPSAPTKQGSFGFKVGFNAGSSDGLVGLFDIDGDGLADQVYGSGGSFFSPPDAFFYRINRSGPSGTHAFADADKALAALGMPALSAESSTMFSFGAEAYPGIGPASIEVMFNHSTSFVTSSAYVADVNGDGLPDIVKDGKIYFNSRSAGGSATFAAQDSSATPLPITLGSVDGGAVLDTFQDIVKEKAKQFPLVDTIRRWIAPFAGKIKISGDVRITRGNPQADGVRVAIQKNGGPELWSMTIDATDTSAHSPAGVDSVDVDAGDRIYFRLGSVFDAKNDEVAWVPAVDYLNVTATEDINGLNIYHYNASEDFTLGGRRGISITSPFKGTMRLSGTMHKTKATTDEIRLEVVRVASGQLIAPTPQSIAANSTGTIDLARDFSVAKDERIAIRVRADSPIDVTAISFDPVPEIVYLNATDLDDQPVTVTDPNGKPTIDIFPPYDVDLYPNSTLTAPQDFLPINTTGTLRVFPSIFAMPMTSGQVVLTIKAKPGTGPGTLLSKVVYPIVNGVVSTPSFNVGVTAGQKLYFDFSTLDESLLALGTSVRATLAPPPAVPPTVPSALHFPAFQANGRPDNFPQSYRGWGVIGYNGNPDPVDGSDRENHPINEDDFTRQTSAEQNPPDPADNKDLDKVKANAGKLKDDIKVYIFVPAPHGEDCPSPSVPCTLPHVGLWRGPDDFTYVTSALVSSSRLGPDDMGVPVLGGPGQAAVSAVPRLSRTEQTGLAIGAGVDGLNGSGSFSSGHSQSEVDFFDMNGDGFPDVVTRKAGIQYTRSNGTLGNLVGSGSDPISDDGGRIRKSDSTAVGAGVGGTPAEFKGNGQGRAAATGASTPKTAKNGTQMQPLGINVGGNGSHSDTKFDLMDVNGDGLPDRVIRTSRGAQVQINLGYEFGPAEDLLQLAAPASPPAPPIKLSEINAGNGKETTGGVSLGANDGIYGFAGGLSLAKSSSRTRAYVRGLNIFPLFLGETGQTLADVNGDGLLDKITPDPDHNAFTVAFNTGNQFGPDVSWKGALPAASGEVTTSGNLYFGGGFYFTIPIPLIICGGCAIIINPGAEHNEGSLRQEVLLSDIDGDGYPDHLFSDSRSHILAALNKTGRTNLLARVERPLGAAIDLEYERSGNTFEQPHNRWVLSRVTTFDGLADDSTHPAEGADFQVTTYRYKDFSCDDNAGPCPSNGFYDRFEREFYGFSQIAESQLDTRGAVTADAAKQGAVYQRILRTFRNRTFFEKGLLETQVVQGVSGATVLTFSATDNHYVLREVSTGLEIDPSDVGKLKSTPSAVFPQLRTTLRHVSEGDPTIAISTEVRHSYDEFGNVTEMIDLGGAGADDDLHAIMTYTGTPSGRHASCATPYIVGLADSIAVSDGAGRMLRQREADFDCGGATGDMLELRQFTGTGPNAVSTFTYEPNGNLHDAQGPTNQFGQRYRLEYQYDISTQTHVSRVTDSFGYVSSAAYDDRFGEATRRTDINGNVMSYVYDPFGRVNTVTGPLQQGTGRTTLAFDYAPDASPAVAVTHHNDEFRDPSDPIDTILFIDGMKRVVQTKKDGTIHQGSSLPAIDMMIVSGRETFDHRGRIVRSHYPTTEPKLFAANIQFSTITDSVQASTRAYDFIDRIVSSTLADNSTTSFVYELAADSRGTLRSKITSTDAETNQAATFRDIRDQIREVHEFNRTKNQEIVTSYDYDALRQLVLVKDDRGNVTRASYDLLGRQTFVDNLDAGRTELIYDAASNLVRKVTANLRAQGRAIEFDYEFNRLRSIRYPNFPENDVTYEYGGQNLFGQPGNQVGRIIRVTDESGSEERRYDALGETVEETKTVASDTQGNSPNSPEVWTTRYVYDTWGRLQQLTYPDAEVLTYHYDSGGLVREVRGDKLGHPYPYVTRLEYDKFSQRVFQSMGNGIETTFAYDPRNRRLNQLEAGPFQKLLYGYDKVGNVTDLVNDEPPAQPNEFGGRVEQHFDYDGLYRLTHASGSWRFEPNKTDQYSITLDYDTTHNITRKTQDHSVTNPGGNQAIPKKKTSYDFTYSYTGSRPHAATQIGERAFSYDANGNQTGWDDLTNGQRRTITWDEENRIQSIADNGRTTTYKYNDVGERVIKRGMQGETAYINQFWTVRNRSVGTKHVFVGRTRMVSKLSPGEANINPNSSGRGNDLFTQALGNWWMHRSEEGGANAQNLDKNPHYTGGLPHRQPTQMPDHLPEDNFVYFYHPDHLGSTEFVTDKEGELFEHAEYFPFGEQWVLEHSNTQRTPYLFASKEFDEETELYYFGARYYDPRTSVWQSPDPMLAARFANTAGQNPDGFEAGGGELGRNGGSGDIPDDGLFRPSNLALYTYGHNNPLRLVDPDGRDPIDQTQVAAINQLITAGKAAPVGSAEKAAKYNEAIKLALTTYTIGGYEKTDVHFDPALDQKKVAGKTSGSSATGIVVRVGETFGLQNARTLAATLFHERIHVIQREQNRHYPGDKDKSIGYAINEVEALDYELSNLSRFGFRLGGASESSYVKNTRSDRQHYFDQLPQFYKDRVNGVSTKDHIPDYTLKKEDIGK